MAENKKGVEQCWRIIYNPKHQFNDSYGLCFLTSDSYSLLLEALSELRRSKEIDWRTYYVIRSIYRYQYKNSIKVKELDAAQPRFIAQKFISKKSVRQLIFTRDKNACLKCGAIEKLTLDHITPIHLGGENKIGNLQTLCASCNSKKGIQIQDYR